MFCSCGMHHRVGRCTGRGGSLETAGVKQSFWSLLGLWPKVTRAGARNDLIARVSWVRRGGIVRACGRGGCLRRVTFFAERKSPKNGAREREFRFPLSLADPFPPTGQRERDVRVPSLWKPTPRGRGGPSRTPAPTGSMSGRMCKDGRRRGGTPPYGMNTATRSDVTRRGTLAPPYGVCAVMRVCAVQGVCAGGPSGTPAPTGWCVSGRRCNAGRRREGTPPYGMKLTEHHDRTFTTPHPHISEQTRRGTLAPPYGINVG